MALPNGHYILFAYDEQPYAMDTVVIGGDPNATVEGLIIQELDQNQNLLFQWRSWDHFHVLDNIYIDTLGNQFPFIHCNAIDLDFDGHFLIFQETGATQRFIELTVKLFGVKGLSK